MEKFARSWDLMAASWRMLLSNKLLLVFPLISGIALLFVIAMFTGPTLIIHHGFPPDFEPRHQSPQFYVATFVFYFVAYVVIFFFNTALIACVIKQVDGEVPTLGFGLAFAWKRLSQIMGWALVSSTVGVLLGLLEDKAGKAGRFAADVLGTAWSITAFLVVPVLVVEGCGPIAAYKRSVQLLKQSWGEQLIGNVSFGLVGVVLSTVPAVILVFIAIKQGPSAFPVIGAIFVLWMLALGLVLATLQTIYQAALYVYAVTGDAPTGFDGSMVANAFSPKPQPLI